MNPSQDHVSRTCFVFSDGEGGYTVTMMGVDRKAIRFPLTAERAARLLEELASASADLMRQADAKKAGEPEKYFQR